MPAIPTSSPRRARRPRIARAPDLRPHVPPAALAAGLLVGLSAAAAVGGPDPRMTPWIRIEPIPPVQSSFSSVADISRDGQWIFYVRTTNLCFEGSDPRIYCVRPDGTGRELLTPTGPPYFEFDWARSSADGSRVVVLGGSIESSCDGWEYADPLLIDRKAGTMTPLFVHGGEYEIAARPDISWDGTVVAWEQWIWAGSGSGIWLWREGTGTRKRGVDGDERETHLLGLTGDGRRIVFSQQTGPDAAEVFVLDLTSGGPPVQATDLGGWISTSAADMDDFGRRAILLWRSPTTNSETFSLVDLETGKIRRLPYGPYARISADGSTAVVFTPVKGPNSKKPRWVTLRIDLEDGTEVPILADSCFQSGAAALSFDGSWMALGAFCLSQGINSDLVHVTDPSPPSLKAAGDLAPGGHVSIFVHGDPGAATLLFGAAAPGETAIPGFGTFLLDPARAVLLARAVLDEQGLFEIRRTVPASLPFGGETLLLQALVTKPAGFTNVLALDVPP